MYSYILPRKLVYVYFVNNMQVSTELCVRLHCIWSEPNRRT